MEEGHVCGQRAQIVRAEVENLQVWQHSQVLQMAWRYLIIGQVQGMQVREAAHDQLKLIDRVVLHIQLLQRHQIHQLVHLDAIVGDVKIGQVLEELKILLSHIIDIHAGQLRANRLMGQLDSA